MKHLYLTLTLFFSLLSCAHAEKVYATFTVEANQSANLAFSTSGTVEKVYADIGSIVKKGDPLAKLHNDDLAALLESAKTAYKYAKRDYERQLKVKKIIDKAQLDRYASKFELAKAQMKYQQALLDKTVLKAPFDGVIFAKSIEAGDVVSGAMIRTVFQIQSLHARKLILEFDQKYWNRIQPGALYTYRIDGSEKQYRGTISKIYPVVESGSRKRKAEVPAQEFPVGLFGDGTIQTDQTDTKK